MELDEYRRMHALEERHWWFRAKRRMVYDLLRAWLPGSGRRVLDLGCGTGITLLELPPRYHGIGVDPSPEALSFCRSRGLRALARASATDLPLETASVDGVLALDIIEHIDDDVAALREIGRVLRPDGAAMLTVPAFPFLWSSHDEALHHKRRYTRALLEGRLAEAGLKVRAGGYGQATIFPAALLLRLGRRWLGGAAGSDVREVPAWLNEAVYLATGWEVPLARRGRLPFGLSLVYVVGRSKASGRAPEPASPRSAS